MSTPLKIGGLLLSVSTDKKKEDYIIQSNNVMYSLNDTCPICGAYTSEGEVCTNCLKVYNLHKDNYKFKK